LQTFQLPDGYRMELVLSERDDVREPVCLAFDGNGRMYVAEMRGFMQDIRGTGEDQHNGRVSRHESTKNDGRFDKHTVFAGQLLLPRMILPLDDRVLINETNSLDLYSYRDTTGSGVADRKDLAFAGGPVSVNLEHQQSGLVWALDNWVYMATQPIRLRFSPQAAAPQESGIWNWLKGKFKQQPKLAGAGILVQHTPPNGGQWGLAQDDYGKLWWSNGGAEIALYHFQVPIIYGVAEVPQSQPPDFPEVWPLVGIPDVQAGKIRYRPDGTLNHFTAACGQEIVRGDCFPKDLRGDALVCEPVGRLIRRAKVEIKDAVTTIRNPYEHSEFIRSTDPCFRPVSVANGPDGCLYIVDMYRGIVEESEWLREGKHLYDVVKQYGLDKITGHGRIWRLVHKDFAPHPAPHLLAASANELVHHLESPNGWTRDTAQKLLVFRGDKSVVPALETMAGSSTSGLGRIHMLWTLEGLNALSPAVVLQALKDSDPQVRVAAIRSSESLGKNEMASVAAAIRTLSQDPAPEVVLQVLLTGKRLQWPDLATFADKTMAATSSQGVKDIGMLILNESESLCGPEFSQTESVVLARGQAIYQQVCFACHGFDGRGMPMDGGAPGATLAPPFTGARDEIRAPEGTARILLHGLDGPIGGKTYPAQMVSMATNDDAWIAAVVSYIRNSFGNHGGVMTPDEVARLRLETKDRVAPWSANELLAALPAPMPNKSQWLATASVNNDEARLAIDGQWETGWRTARMTQPGDWFQLQLPAVTTIAGLRLENRKDADEFPGGYEVRFSTDGQKWSEPVSKGHGTTGITEMAFSPAPAKFIRVIMVKSLHHARWSIDEAEILLPSPLDKRVRP
jgi:putative membrane-bound dehydrogenase-like protein